MHNVGVKHEYNFGIICVECLSAMITAQPQGNSQTDMAKDKYLWCSALVSTIFIFFITIMPVMPLCRLITFHYGLALPQVVQYYRDRP
ncbi:MAG: hypothetical protein IPJ13_00945 [Saprospiraceae bacterium]|nr:hypothetical protein [Saprospiraceae bacterium]